MVKRKRLEVTFDGLAIRLTRHERAMTQRDVAEKARVGLRTYVRMENEKLIPYPSTVRKVCAVLGLKFDSVYWVKHD